MVTLVDSTAQLEGPDARRRPRRRAARGARRPDRARPADRQPGQQRGEVHARRRHGHGLRHAAATTRSSSASPTTASGISEEDQAGLFRAFFRTTNPEALSEPGTGLGLAIVATIVERHEGRVDVDSRLGEGTTFTVTLPLARSASERGRPRLDHAEERRHEHQRPDRVDPRLAAPDRPEDRLLHLGRRARR